ncbi:MAG: hypothetical protein A2234_04630 [Elusimicrobia bacterium RIFOXYA2_FULL_58_8]|nr:MAG: hypothetical protein A2234_04630 [Elusimicrobia bacterium RIFOXYA2_FULL_58_8]OGS14011.1 MAG: hypothetical protein A2285_02835 [Elusimicrobia bacterium RIFOXYA12_FULL_57_11]
MTGPDKRNMLVVWACVAAAAVAGIGLLVASVQLSRYGMSGAARFSTDIRLSCFTREACQTLAHGAGIGGAAFMLAALVLVLVRRRIIVSVAALREGFRVIWRETVRLWRGLLREPLTLWPLLVITLTGAAVRAVYLSQPIRVDEAATYMLYASKPFYQALIISPNIPNNHPLHTLMVRGFSLLLGNQPWVLRMPAFLAGVACVPAVYLAARRFYGKAPALVTAALVAASSVLAGYSVNARGYTMICLAFLLLLTLATYLYRSRNRAGWLAYAILGMLGLFTVPVMLYPLGMVAMWLCLMTIVSQPRAQWAGGIGRISGYTALSCLLAAVLYGPVITVCGLKVVVTNNYYVFPLPWREFAAAFLATLREVGLRWTGQIPLPLVALLAGGAAAAVLANSRVSRYPVSLATAAVLFLVPVLAAQHVAPFARVWAFLLPVCFMLAAVGICLALAPLAARLGPRKEFAWALLALGLAAGLGRQVTQSGVIPYSDETGVWRDARAVAATLRSRLQPGDRVLYYLLGEWPFKYYFSLQGTSDKYLTSEPREALRFWVAVAHNPGYWPLERIIAESGIEANRFLPPREVQRYPEAVLYLLAPR